MGLVSKLKNILFEEEEVEIPVLEKKEENKAKVVEELPKKEENLNINYNFYDEKKQEENKRGVEPIKEENSFKENNNNLNNNGYNFNDKIDIKNEKTFNFPSFDEEEFEEVIPRRSTNILEHERKKVKERFTEKPVIKASNPTPSPEVTKPKFRPSPIISPVYGILDKNYTPDDITTREPEPTTLDVDSVRKKAFGTLEEKIDLPTNIKDIEESFDKEVNEENIYEEKLEKARTIDELLKDSSDEVINVQEEKNTLPNLDNLEDTITDLRMQIKNNNNDVNESLEKKEVLQDVIKEEDESKDENLESDLFDLIDSMYENREDGE